MLDGRECTNNVCSPSTGFCTTETSCIDGNINTADICTERNNSTCNGLNLDQIPAANVYNISTYCQWDIRYNSTFSQFAINLVNGNFCSNPPI